VPDQHGVHPHSSRFGTARHAGRRGRWRPGRVGAVGSGPRRCSQGGLWKDFVDGSVAQFVSCCAPLGLATQNAPHCGSLLLG